MEKTSLVSLCRARKMGYFMFWLLLQASAIQSVFGEGVSTESTVLELPLEYRCVKEGNFPVPGSCTDFYHCRKTSDGSFQEIINTCPSGMSFDTSTAKCLVQPLATSQFECPDVPANSTSAGNCWQVLTEDIIMTVTQTCQFMRHINEYVMAVISTLPSRLSLPNYREFDTIAPDYNEVLTRAKTNVKVWRNGNDIFSDTESLFTMALQFGKEFTRKYNIHMERRKAQYVSDQYKDEEKILEIQEHITALERDIADLKEVLNKTSSPEVKSFLEMRMKNKQREIVEKRRQINRTSPVGRELEEVAAFMEFANNDAEQVRQRAESLENRMQLFYKNLENDFASFGNIIDTAKEGMAGLLDSKESLKAKALYNREDLESLETSKKQKEAMLAFLNDAADSKSSEIREKIREIQSKEEDYLNQKNRFCLPQNMILSLLTFSSMGSKNLTACNELEATYNASITKDVNEMEALNDEFSRINIQRFQLLSQLGNIMENMTLSHDLIGKDVLAQQPEGELKAFEVVVDDVRRLHNMAIMTLSSVTESTKSIIRIETIFQAISDNLTEMITKARTTTTTDTTKDEIDAGLLYLRCLLEDVPGTVKCHEEH